MTIHELLNIRLDATGVHKTRSLITVRDWQLLPLRDFVALRAPTSLLACGGALQSTGD